MTDIDPAAFGLPTDVNGQVGFMYDQGDLQVDVNDPIYQQVKAAMEADAAARGATTPPLPSEAPRPAALIPVKEGDNAAPTEPDPTAPSPNPVTEPAPESPAYDPAAGIDPAAEPGQPVPAAATERPDSFALTIDGNEYAVTTEQVEYLLRTNSWLESVPDETKQQWSAIEQGTAVAVSIEELTRLRAAAQVAQQPANRTPQPPNVDDLDDDAIEYIRSLESRIASMQPAPAGQAGQQPPGNQPSAPEIAAAAQRQAERTMQMRQQLETTNAAWQAEYSLTDEQMERVTQVATDLAVVPAISRSHTQYSPTGQVIREPVFNDVIREAYGVAMSTDPTLRAMRDEMVYNQRVAQEAQRNGPVNAKKAKAGTLASTPSAAVPASGATPVIGPDNKMNLQATSEAIAAALAQMSEQG